jgi:hypothetical protein
MLKRDRRQALLTVSWLMKINKIFDTGNSCGVFAFADDLPLSYQQRAACLKSGLLSDDKKQSFLRGKEALNSWQ